MTLATPPTIRPSTRSRSRGSASPSWSATATQPPNTSASHNGVGTEGVALSSRCRRPAVRVAPWSRSSLKASSAGGWRRSSRLYSARYSPAEKWCGGMSVRLFKRRLTTALGTHLINPVVRFLVENGIAPPSYAILETIGVVEPLAALAERVLVALVRAGDEAVQ